MTQTCPDKATQAEFSAATALDTFGRCGVGVVRGLLDAQEVRALVDETQRLWDAQTSYDLANLRFGVRPDAAGKQVLERIDPVADISDRFAALNREPRLVALAEAALGEPVTVLKEKLIYKWPGTAGYGAHRDAPYLEVSGTPGAEILTCIVALDPTTIENGTTEFFPGLRLIPTPAPAEEPRDVAEEAVEGEWSLMPELAAGDVVLFDALVPHRSRTNLSDRPRRTYMIGYAPARYADCRERYYAERLRQQALARAPHIDRRAFFR